MHWEKGLFGKIKMKIFSLPLLHALLNFTEQHLYGTISGMIIAGGLLCFSGCIFTGDAESARYLLSGLGQSLATIFALFFTISLATFQTILGKYTTRLYKYFFDRRGIAFSLFFIGLVFAPFVILSRIYEEGSLTNFHLFLVNVDVILSGVLLALLVPYTYFELLMRKMIGVDKLLEKITSSVIKWIKEVEYGKADEKMVDLLEITRGAARLNEERTFRYCVKGWLEILKEEKEPPPGVYYKYENGFLPLFKTENKELVKEGISEIVDNVSIPFFECKLTDESIKRAKKGIDVLYDIYERILSKYPGLAESIIEYFRSIGQIATNCYLKYPKEVLQVTKEVVSKLGSIAEGQKNVEMAKKAIDEIDNIEAQVLLYSPEFDEEKIKVKRMIEDEFREIRDKTPFDEVRRLVNEKLEG